MVPPSIATQTSPATVVPTVEVEGAGTAAVLRVVDPDLVGGPAVRTTRRDERPSVRETVPDAVPVGVDAVEFDPDAFQKALIERGVLGRDGTVLPEGVVATVDQVSCSIIRTVYSVSVSPT